MYHNVLLKWMVTHIRNLYSRTVSHSVHVDSLLRTISIIADAIIALKVIDDSIALDDFQ